MAGGACRFGLMALDGDCGRAGRSPYIGWEAKEERSKHPAILSEGKSSVSSNFPLGPTS
jgi:hypothetical protein